MSKLSCVCGYVIRDQQGNLPYKGRIIRDQHLESLFDSVVEDLNKFISAKVT